MRLLKVEPGGNFSLVERVGNGIPRYAILSHTWGEDNEEFSFTDIINGIGSEKPGFRKIQFCGEQAAKDKLDYFWVDTCCIDKSSSTEVQEAINSMFQWYFKAAKCYAYLADVSCNGPVNVDESFRKSRWFTRGWTLQELIAPAYVEFYSSEHKRIGDKISKVQTIHDITGISVQALQGRPLHQFSIEVRKSWAANRHTKREEDLAYSLLGIFNIYMPLLYGEGRKNAFARLERKIRKSESQLYATRSMGASIQQVDYGEGLSSSRPEEGQQELSERSNIAGILNVQMSALEHTESRKGAKATSHYNIPTFEDHTTMSQFMANVFGALGAVIKDPHGVHSKFQDLEAVLGRLDHAGHLMDTHERPQSQLRSDPGDHGKVFDSPRVYKENSDEKNRTPFSKLMKDAFRRKEMLAQQVEIIQSGSNRDSSCTLSMSSAACYLQQLNELERHLKDKQVQDRDGHEGTYAILQFLSELQLNEKRGSRDAVNIWLDVAGYNDHYNPTQHFNKQVSSRLEGTCEWILSHPSYHAWISDEHAAKEARVLWIYGPAGHGKTVLCAKLVQDLKAKQLFPVAYFFASPHAQSGGDPNFIVRSWISQIAQLDSGVLGLVRRHCEAGEKASDSAIWSLFRSIISEDRSYFFFLDGLDEYSPLEDARALFLQRLQEATKRTTSRVLITSRDETDIHAKLAPMANREASYIVYLCKVTEEEVQYDISRFASSVVSKKLPNKDDSLRQNLAGQLAQKCKGMFLWIKLQQDQLRGGKNAKQLQNIVNNMPVGLHRTYERNWRVIQALSTEDKKRTLAILEWATCAFRPLTVAEITDALIVECNDDVIVLQWDEIPDDIDEEYISSEIVNICGGLVETRAAVPEGTAAMRTIHLIHSSVREFLLHGLSPGSLVALNPFFEPTQSITQTERHARLAKLCIAYLDHEETWQRFSEQEISGHRCNFIDYAAKNWDLHMKSSGNDKPNLVCQVQQFFQEDNKSFACWAKYIDNHGKSPDTTQKEKWGPPTPLYYAAFFDLPEIVEHILKHDATQLNRVGGKYGTPLQAVCFKGDESMFTKLLSWGADPNAEGGEFGVPINSAITEGHQSIVKALLNKGVNHALKDATGRTPLYTAAMRGNYEALCWLIASGAEKEMPNIHGWTPINAAAAGGHLKVIELLLEECVDFEKPNIDGATPLYTAALNGNVEVLKLLLEKGANFTVTGDNGWTPLNVAAEGGHLEIVTLLLEKGAELTAPDNDGDTPFYTAATNGRLDIAKLLLEKGADLTIANKYGWTPLTSAANHGHLEVIKMLLDKGVDFTVPDKDGWTPLKSAASGGHLEVVKLLLEKGVDITIPDKEGCTPLKSAASGGHLEVVKLLLEKEADITVLDKEGWTPLNSAAKEGHLEVVKLLLEKGADMTVPSNHHWTPLVIAAFRGHINVVKLLLEKGADLLALTEDGWTPLKSAASGGHLEVVKLLLEKGADITVLDKEGWTPLNSAAKEGHLEVVKLLLEKGADMTVPSNHHWTPLVIAAFRGHINVVKLLLEKGADMTVPSNHHWTPLVIAAFRGHINVVKLLLEKGADMTVPDKEGWTPLNSAAKEGHLEVVKLLLEKGADMTVPSNHHWTPLVIAAFRGHINVIKLLLEKGADLLALTEDGWTPLKSAAIGGHLKVVQLLLEKGADMTVLDKEGWTPLNSAARGGHLEVVKLLLEKGADMTVPNKEGWTPLKSAAREGHLEVVKLLLEKAVDVATHSEEYVTALQAAILTCSVPIVRLLLERGADPAAKDKHGWTPSMIAFQTRNREIHDIFGVHEHDLQSGQMNVWHRVCSQLQELLPST